MNEDIDEINEETLIRLKLLSKRLDESIKIPGTNYKIGIDPLIGLIPGGGDILGGILSMYIMYIGIQMGAPRNTIKKMFKNILLELTIGWIPVIGDLFDMVWKSNRRNVELLEQTMLINKKDTAIGYIVLIVLILCMILIIMGIYALSFRA